MMRVIDVVLSLLASLFRFHGYPPLEKLYSVFLFVAGLSLRDLSERLSYRRVEDVCRDMGPRVLLSPQAVQRGEEGGRCR
jgi:hypothetical protein